MPADSTQSCSYTVFSGGDSAFIRSVSAPLSEALSADLAGDGEAIPADGLPEFLGEIDSRPQNDGGILIGGIVGVFAFFGSWLASKVLDDIYEAKFQPSIKMILGSADKKLDGANANQPKMLQVGFSFSEKCVFILIGIIDDTFDAILQSEHMIGTVHKNAVAWIEANELAAPVHLYLIDHGTVNLEPLVFDSLSAVHRHLRTIEPKTKT